MRTFGDTQGRDRERRRTRFPAAARLLHLLALSLPEAVESGNIGESAAGGTPLGALERGRPGSRSIRRRGRIDAGTETWMQAEASGAATRTILGQLLLS